MCWRCGWGSFGGDIGTRYHRDTQTETETETWTNFKNWFVTETEAEFKYESVSMSKTTAENETETETETGATFSWHHHMPFLSLYEWRINFLLDNAPLLCFWSLLKQVEKRW